MSQITIRVSSDADAAALARLAVLDSRAPQPGRMLVAEVDGEIRAGLPLSGAPAIADPFHPSAELVKLLQLRARQLGVGAPRRGAGTPLLAWRRPVERAA